MPREAVMRGVRWSCWVDTATGSSVSTLQEVTQQIFFVFHTHKDFQVHTIFVSETERNKEKFYLFLCKCWQHTATMYNLWLQERGRMQVGVRKLRSRHSGSTGPYIIHCDMDSGRKVIIANRFLNRCSTFCLHYLL